MMLLTCASQMLLYLLNKIPDFQATFRVLKTQGVIHAIWFSPNDESFYI